MRFPLTFTPCSGATLRTRPYKATIFCLCLTAPPWSRMMGYLGKASVVFGKGAVTVARGPAPSGTGRGGTDASASTFSRSLADTPVFLLILAKAVLQHG